MFDHFLWSGMCRNCTVWGHYSVISLHRGFVPELVLSLMNFWGILWPFWFRSKGWTTRRPSAEGVPCSGSEIVGPWSVHFPSEEGFHSFTSFVPLCLYARIEDLYSAKEWASCPSSHRFHWEVGVGCLFLQRIVLIILVYEGSNGLLLKSDIWGNVL